MHRLVRLCTQFFKMKERLLGVMHGARLFARAQAEESQKAGAAAELTKNQHAHHPVFTNCRLSCAGQV
jgi:hypothetical protein